VVLIAFLEYLNTFPSNPKLLDSAVCVTRAERDLY